ncbi:ABC transporter permease [Sneathiella litorea]|uniref:ABC transporter permease subunit n=1 Tax=Sneathiella litorea TaxID=2606216 RepID=A0A6L8W7E9_9PROT|nr:ABC transporter permease [Sneathiella litorea]MZR30300.1 ABC transporter permease subunit [Sneathiella litorea]
MTEHAETSKLGLWRRLYDGKSFPVFVVVLSLLILWYAGAVYMNSDRLIDQYERGKVEWSWQQLIEDAWSMERPILPAPQQIVVELRKTVLEKKITSKRSLVYHSYVTISSTLVGFALGALLGILLAVGIVHLETLDRSLMPWIIASQTVPILAIAPMIIVVLGHIGLTGLVPKAIISMYLCFFPITIGMVKGLRSPDVLQLDLMKTYSASAAQVFWKLRMPASIPFLFASLKVAIAISLVGAIVAELPTGAVEGLGARLLAGSYYGQTIQIWSALVAASVLGMLLVWAVTITEKLVLGRTGREAV